MLSPMLFSVLPFTLGRAKSTQTLDVGVLTYLPGLRLALYGLLRADTNRLTGTGRALRASKQQSGSFVTVPPFCTICCFNEKGRSVPLDRKVVTIREKQQNSSFATNYL